MHPTEVDEGVLLAERYRVAALLAEAPGDGGSVAQTWRAVDEVLSRSVVVHVLSAEDPRAEEVLDASRRAATVSDVRFLRVLDAFTDSGEDGTGLAYVVREWVDGKTLAELLAENPIPPRDAGLVIREVAEAVGRAHEQDLYHERLDPDSIVVTDGGTIKIVGLATHAALTGHDGPEMDPARADTVGLGRLLYTALTGRWPTGPMAGLPAAPRAADGTLLSPRQCRAGVPRSLDEITERILSERPRHGTPLAHPQDIVDALTGTVGSTPAEGVLASSRPIVGTAFVVDPANDRTAAFRSHAPAPPPDPPFQPTQPARYDRAPAGYERTPAPARQLPPPGQRRYRPAEPTGPRWSRIGIVLVSVMMVAGLALLGWQLISQTGGGQGAGKNPSSTLPPAPTGRGEEENPVGGGEKGKGKGEPKGGEGDSYEAVGVDDYDPLGDGEEGPSRLEDATDGDPSTFWLTQTYYSPMEGQKEGLGIWFDLGEDREVGKVDLSLYGEGSDLEIRVAPAGSASPPAEPSGWTAVGSAQGAGSEAAVELDDPVDTRYVLVWFTKLPPDGSDFRGGVSQIAIGP